jgi:hypothetical protein
LKLPFLKIGIRTKTRVVVLVKKVQVFDGISTTVLKKCIPLFQRNKPPPSQMGEK